MAEENKKRSILSRVWEFLIWVFGGLVVAATLFLINPWVSYCAAILSIIGGLFVLSGKISFSRFGKARAVGLLWFGLISVLGTAGYQASQAELAELRQNSPVEYLVLIRERQGDEAWLRELQLLDPAAHQDEVERRRRVAAEEAAAQAEAEESRRLQRIADANEARERAARAQAVRLRNTFEDALRSAEAGVNQPVELPTRISDVRNFLRRVDRYASTFRHAEVTTPSAEEAERLERLRRDLIAFQVREFPRVRDALGPALRRELWIDDASAKTIGSGYRTVEFTSLRYALNRNTQSDFQTVRSTLRQLRFNRVIFRQYEGGQGVSYDLSALSPDDNEIVEWRNNMPRRLRGSCADTWCD